MTDRAYGRISRDNERSGSIAKQRARLAQHATADVEWYVDESVSGAKVPFAERPAGSQLLADLAPGDRVLVTKIDRAARSVTDLLGLVRLIDERGASVVFVDQNIDTSGPMGRFMLTLLGAVAELEAAIVAERVMETRAAFRLEGRFGGGPTPFGLTVVPNPEGRGLVLRPHPEDGPLAREVIERVMAGEAQRQLAPLVGLRPPGFSQWLRNPALAGIREGADVEVDPEAALLSLAEWQALQAFLSGPRKAWTRSTDFGAALRCGVCGGRLYYGANKRYPESSVYRCNRQRHADGDPAVAVVRRHADAFVVEDFLDRMGDDEIVEVVTVQSSGARDEAVALARLRLDAAKRAFDDARDDEAEDDALEAQRAAKRALRTAEALPTDTVTEERSTGLTYRELWPMLPEDERGAFLAAAGPWTVHPGRGLDIAEKVTYTPKESPEGP